LTKAKMPVIVRPLHSADKAEWRVLWAAYLDFYGTSVADDVYDTAFARMPGSDPRDFNCLVAEVDGKLVGLTHYLFHRHSWKVEDVCYLQDLYATADTRGTGFGRALIEAVYDAANQAGALSVYWLTQDDNMTARKLYNRTAALTNFIKYQRVAS
jgi:GNAT superfamily N-acetyltransferase